MLLSSRTLRSRKRQLLLSIIATCCAFGIDATLVAANDASSGSVSEQPKQSQEDDEVEMTLRPARPFNDASASANAKGGEPAKTLPFRKPDIKTTTPAKTAAGVTVPAKTVSNRTPATVTPTRPASEGWVARDAVNLDQPLRDPDSQPVFSPYDSLNSPAANSGTMATVTPETSYVGDEFSPVETKKELPVEQPKVRPTLVLPKDRTPLTPPAQVELAPASQPAASQPVTNTPAASQPAATEKPANKPSVETSVEAIQETAAKDKDLAAKKSPPLAERSSDQSRVDRILDQLLPADGTATKSLAIPKTKMAPVKSAPALLTPTDSVPQLQSPSNFDSAKKSSADKLEQIASSKSDAVVIRELKIDSDGADASKERSTSTAKQQESSPSPTADSARSYLGDLDSREFQGVTEREEPKALLDYAGIPTAPRQVGYQTTRLQPGMSRVLNYFYSRPEVADERSNWGMLHSIMVYGTDTRVQVGKKAFSAIAWIAGNNFCRGQRLAEDSADGIRIKSGVGLQGHQGQMLAIFSLCGVPAEYPIYADGKQYTINDVVEAEKLACKTGEELTFTLIALSHYLDSNATWVAADGEVWSIERLIEEELAQPIVGAACGGTHRLMGFGHALRNRRMQGEPMTGQWARAEKFTEDFVRYAYQLQNRDGSMSTNWFEGREDNGDVDRKIQTTGHMVEWLLTVTPDSQLENPRLVQAIRFLLSSMNNDLGHDWSIGPKGHALRSLAMYHQRVFGSSPWQSGAVARRSSNSASR